jgi:signal transduction histidine kinase
MQNEKINQLAYKYLCEQAAVLFLVLSREGEILEANKYAEEFIGSALRQRPFREVLVDFTRTHDLSELIRNPGKVFLLNVNTFTGLPQTLYFNFFDLGERIYVFGKTDMTELETLRKWLVSANNELNNLAREIQKKNSELEKLNDALELRVEERTAALVKANRQLQNEIVERKQAEYELLASRERLRALSAHLQSLREQDRLAIARDLHDELGQALTSLKMDISMLERKAKSANGKFDGATVLGDIATMQERIAGTIKHVRSLITELRPEVLDTLGLVPALEWQLEEFHNRTGLAYEFNAEVEELHLAKEHALAVFRIFQESLTNIARHAEASQVKAKIEKRDHALWIEIADNGKGISPEALNATGKFGLLGMRERALVFGGEVSITGAPGHGTTVKVKAPLSG